MHEKMSYLKIIFSYISKVGTGERSWIPSQALRTKKEESRHASVIEITEVSVLGSDSPSSQHDSPQSS